MVHLARAYWRQKTSVKDQLYAEPFKFEFHQAIKILECLYPELEHLGEAVNPHGEVISISSRVSYSYPPSDIYSLEINAQEKLPHKLSVNFLGIAGAQAPLPMPYTEQIIARNQREDFASQDFIDVFNHRILSIFHRIRKKYWVGLANGTPDESRLAQVLYSLCGLGLTTTRNISDFHDRSQLFMTNHFWRRVRSTSALQSLIEYYFNVITKIETNVGAWVNIESEDQTKLGLSNSVLGMDTVAGQQVWDQNHGICIIIDLQSWQEYLTFLPNGPAWKILNSLLKTYLGIKYTYNIQLKLEGNQIPLQTLGKSQRLGWNTWLNSGSITKKQYVNL